MIWHEYFYGSTFAGNHSLFAVNGIQRGLALCRFNGRIVSDGNYLVVFACRYREHD